MKTICIPFFYFLFFTSNVAILHLFFPSFPSSRIILLIFFPTFLFPYRRRYYVSSRRLLVLSSDSGLSSFFFLEWLDGLKRLQLAVNFEEDAAKVRAPCCLEVLCDILQQYIWPRSCDYSKSVPWLVMLWQMLSPALCGERSWRSVEWIFWAWNCLRRRVRQVRVLTCEVCLNKLLYLRF